MKFSRAIAPLLAAAAITASSTAFAYPQLLSSTPADGAVLAPASRIELLFSEPLVAQSSAANLVMTEMPGMAGHGPMKVAFTVAAGPDGKTMVIIPARPLPKGTYRLDWRAVSADARPVNGSITFQVN